jgi:hypothetical protein
MLNLFGLSFVYNSDESLVLFETGLTLEELIINTNKFLKTQAQINERGYVNMSSFDDPDHFLNKIALYLMDSGFEKPKLGGNKTAYAL